MAQMRIFLSHSSSDKEFADALAGALREAGADVWYDESHLGTGQLLDEITEQLQSRPVFLVVLSKAAFASVWVRRECKWAYNLYDRETNRMMLPVIAQPIDVSDWNTMLWLEDFRRVSGPDGQPYPLREAISHTVRLLALTPQGEAPAPVAPQPAESAADLVDRGKALSAQQRYAEAMPLFERASQLDPRSIDAWFNIGYVGVMTREWQKTLNACERTILLDPRHAAAWSNKGAALNGLQRYAEGLPACEQAIALDPKLAAAWNGKGSALNGLQRYTEALAAYDQALALDPKLIQAWTGKGAVLINLRRYAEGLAACEQAIVLDPRHALAWKNKSLALRNLGRAAEADQAARRAGELGA